MAVEISDQRESEWAAMGKVARLLGVGTAETVRKWVRRAQVDAGAVQPRQARHKGLDTLRSKHAR